MKKTIELYEQVEKMRSQINKNCVKYLKKVLNKEKDNRIDFEPFYEEMDTSLCVCYDGGRHPEYASNCYSQVEAIYLEKDSKGKETIYLDIEDEDEYEISRISTDELYEIAEFIYNVKMG